MYVKQNGKQWKWREKREVEENIKKLQPSYILTEGIPEDKILSVQGSFI